MSVTCTCAKVHMGISSMHTNAAVLPFVSNKHDHHVGTGMLPSIFEPCCQMVKGISSGYIIN